MVLFSEQAQKIINYAKDRSLRIGLIESCTGGMVSSQLTSVPGASACFVGSIVAYSNDLKSNLVGLDPEVLDKHGAVSSQAALGLSQLGRAKLGCDIVVSVTGIAGPGGGTPTKPVGTVFFGLSYGAVDRIEHKVFEGSRIDVQNQSVQFAMELLLEALQ